MLYYNFRLVLRSFLQHSGLPFAEALSEETIQQAFADEGVNFAQDKKDVYTPALTLWAFLSQVLFKGEQRSCLAAVSRVVVLLVALGREPCSGNTGAYCRARAIKISLGMDVLRCKTAEMVRREIWTCLLAYNLLRQTMLQAALASSHSPRQLSFTAALQKVAASWNTLPLCNQEAALRLIEAHLSDLATHQVGDRPDRVEPRAIKRRPKPHKLLTQPRRQARAALCAGAEE